MRVLMIIVDGIGISPSLGLPLKLDGDTGGHSERVRPLPMGGLMVSTRADLDVPGLPQSATGHTTIITGVNAARYMGRHFPGYPMATLVRLIENGNLLKTAASMGLRATYINAFVSRPAILRGRTLRSASAVAAESTGQRFFSLHDLVEGNALYHDFTNEVLIQRGYNVPRLSPECAGRRLAMLAADTHLTLYEYFMTDLAGHSQDPFWASRELRKLERFILSGVIRNLDISSTHVIVCSDHGNVEDLSTCTHTRNPVPTMIWGPQAGAAAEKIATIEDIAPVVENLLGYHASCPR
jgi:hypothetical protein